MIPNEAPRDPYPTEQEIESDYLTYCAQEEEVPEGLKYHPLIVHHDWTRGRDLSQFTEAQLRQMGGL